MILSNPLCHHHRNHAKLTMENSQIERFDAQELELLAMLEMQTNGDERTFYSFFARDPPPSPPQQNQQPLNNGVLSTSHRILNMTMDIITMGFFPIVFTRVLRRLLSVTTFSDDIASDLLRFYYGAEGGETTLIDRFYLVLTKEIPNLSVRWSKWLAIVIHLAYSVSMSAYMVFSMTFFSFCMVYTMTGKYKEVSRFLYTVVRNRNEAF